jgi:peptide/nickel transport system permease protein
MIRYVARRCLVALGLLYAVATIVFLLLHVIPGDPAELLLSGGGVAPDPVSVEELRHRLRLDEPLWRQYVDFLAALAQGDLGASFQDGQKVARDIAQRLPRTLELIGAASLLSLVLGLPLGTLAATRRDGIADRVLASLAGLGLSVPVFITGTLLVLVFAQQLRLVPAGGYVPFATSPGGHLLNLLMPAATIAFGLTAVILRMARSSVLETLERDWVRTARAKGLGPGAVLVRHVVRNALVPVITVLGLHMGALLGGTVLVEYVFNWPGLSGLLVRAVEQRDYPEVQGIVLVVSLLFVLLNLAVDLLYAALDPRIRYA